MAGAASNGDHVSPCSHLSCPRCPGTQEEELVELLARHCYVKLGATLKSDAVRELLPSCVPSKLYRTKTPDKWASIVTTAHAKVSLGRAGHPGPTLTLSFPLREDERNGSLPPCTSHVLGTRPL